MKDFPGLRLAAEDREPLGQQRGNDETRRREYFVAEFLGGDDLVTPCERLAVWFGF